MHTDILIVGSGLSGLALANKLERAGQRWQLIEAANECGGRIMSPSLDGQHFDMGPSWFWPAQPRIKQLVEQFALPVFDQYSEGQILLEDNQGKIHPNRGFGSMKGSYRLAGGMKQLIDCLRAQLPDKNIHLSTTLNALHDTQNTIEAHTTQGTFYAKHIVLALPPRVAAQHIQFSPALTTHQTQCLSAIPTWMASHAKFLAVYEQPFWREQGFSGDAMSQRGPLVEIHDASPNNSGPYALFGFMGVPPVSREQHKGSLLTMATQQLARIFGDALSTPKAIRLVDWAQNPNIATTLDKTSPAMNHHLYGYPPALADLWHGRLHLGSTEMGQQYGGYLEGALEAADHVFERIATM